MNSLFLKRNIASPLISFVRHGHRALGKPPGIAKSLSQVMEERKYEDPVLHKKHDIGFPSKRLSRSEEYHKRMTTVKANRNDGSLEKLARSHDIEISLDEMKSEWLNSAGPIQIRRVAQHYGIYEHLFGHHAYFTPRVAMEIKFKINDDELMPIFYGNRIKPSDAREAPEVSFDATYSFDGNKSNSSLWTLVLTNPDGHLTQQDSEYCHWMVGNIPNGDISKGEVIVPYLQPIPPKGTGYHRYVFILYQQEKKIDLNSYKVSEPFNLEKRTFKNFDFYKTHQDSMTPAGLAFFQADWDNTLKDVYHHKLNMKEPIYEYDFPEHILQEQKHFPIKQPFNLYLDRYMDPKDVNKRFVVDKLSKTHPFNGPEKPLQFPNAHDMRHLPSWVQTEARKKNLGLGRVKELETEDY